MTNLNHKVSKCQGRMLRATGTNHIPHSPNQATDNIPLKDTLLRDILRKAIILNKDTRLKATILSNPHIRNSNSNSKAASVEWECHLLSV
jgi:hypothetical protein